MADEPFAVTVHLVGPTWGVETGRKFTSATVLRRRRAKDKVLREWKEHGTVEGVRSMDLRLALLVPAVIVFVPFKKKRAVSRPAWKSVTTS